MSELIPYTPTTLDSLPEERQHGGGSGAKILILGGKKPSYPGLKCVNFRLVAPASGQRIFSAYKHIFEVLPGTNRYVFAYCPLKMRMAESCYFCERGSQVAASGTVSDLELAKKMESDEVVLAQGVARNDMAKGVQIYEGKWHLLKKIRGWMAQWGAQFDPFAWQMASDLGLIPPDSQVKGSRFEYELAPYPSPLVSRPGQPNVPDVEACAALIKEAVCMREWAFSQVLSYQKQKELYESKMSFAPSSAGPATNAAPPPYQQPQYGAPPQAYGQPPQQPQYGNAPPGYQQPQYQPHQAQPPVQTFTAGPPPASHPQQNTTQRKPIY